MEKRKILGAAFDNLIQILPPVEFKYFFGKILEICSLKFPVNTPTIPKCWVSWWHWVGVIGWLGGFEKIQTYMKSWTYLKVDSEEEKLDRFGHDGGI